MMADKRGKQDRSSLQSRSTKKRRLESGPEGAKRPPVRGTVYPHITQLAAYSQGDRQTFNQYIFPKKPITTEASNVTGLTLQGRQLYLRGREVNTVPLEDALKDFCTWLEQYTNITLLAHNGRGFDFPIVLSALQSVNLYSRFITCVARCVDTLPLFQEVFPGRGPYTQEHLVSGLLEDSYGAHEAVQDAKALGKLVMLASKKSPQAMIKFSFSPASFKTKVPAYRRENGFKDIFCSSDTKESVQKPETEALTKNTNSKTTDESEATRLSDGNRETNDEIKLKYAFLDTEEKMRDCLEELRDALKDDPMIAVDCEGDNLSRDGKLQILSVATNTEAFLVDVGALKSVPFDMGLRAMLEDKNITKLMFDCREDADALLHQYRVKLDGVLDIQLLEIIKRPPIEPKKIESKRSVRLYEVVKLKGLSKCIEMLVDNKEIQEIKKRGAELSKRWGMRPLETEALRYAATDVLASFKLFEKMQPSEEEMKRLRIASGIYVNLKRSQTIRTHDEYERNCYLPIDVIPEKGQTGFARGSVACDECDRYFPRDEFSNIQLRKGTQKCRTCKRVKFDIDVHQNRLDNWERDAERECDVYYSDSDTNDHWC